MPDLSLSGNAVVAPAAQLAHLLLHCEPRDAAPIAAHLSLELPSTMLESATTRDWAALHLAPDEWLLIGPEREARRLEDSFADAAQRWPHSIVDISDRMLSFDVSGSAAETLLAAGCPLDLCLAKFPVGRCTRTLFGKAMVMIWRTAPQAFRLEVARSFAPYILELLALVSREFEAIP